MMCRKLVYLVMFVAMVVPAQASYTSTVVADNPLSFWEFEDAASNDGATCADTMVASPGVYKNRGAPGSGLADISLVLGIIGKAAQFNGTVSGGNGNFIDVPDSSYTTPPYRLESSTTCTIEFWEKAGPTASELYSRFISHAAGGTGNYWVGMETAGGNPGQPFVGVPGSTWYAWPPNILTDGSWHYVVVTYTYDGTNTTAELFIDAISRGTKSVAGALAPPGAWQDLIIGAENHQTYVFNGLVGAMDEVAYYNKVLSQARITAHFNAIPEPATIALLGLGGLALLRRKRS